LEIRNWIVDALITAGIAVSLVVALVLYRAGYTRILPYVDPVIVIILIIVSLPVPVQNLVRAMKRLLLVSDENDIEAEARKQLEAVIEEFGLVDVKIWGLKSGRTHYLFVYTGLKDKQTTLEHLDVIRAGIFKELSALYPQFWADIMFTEIDPALPFEGL
jgi:predicted Co/Zn/Cd cation transporter (cation efflux family)